jgi:hypothetical protein
MSAPSVRSVRAVGDIGKAGETTELGAGSQDGYAVQIPKE